MNRKHHDSACKPATQAPAFGAIRGYDTWCVPSALAALTGLSTDLIRVLSIGISAESEANWNGVPTDTFVPMLASLGIRSAWQDVDALRNSRGMRPTVWRWASTGGSRPGLMRQGLYVVICDNHAILFRDGYVLDNGFLLAREAKHFSQYQQLKKARIEHILAIPDQAYHERLTRACCLGLPGSARTG